MLCLQPIVSYRSARPYGTGMPSAARSSDQLPPDAVKELCVAFELAGLNTAEKFWERTNMKEMWTGNAARTNLAYLVEVLEAYRDKDAVPSDRACSTAPPKPLAGAPNAG